ncbi:hypothetical protein TNCV_3113781 [Trichonephila clavipes]|nr:hypothetical protein TNCV_3113781 [Trichonephila clavipes]
MINGRTRLHMVGVNGTMRRANDTLMKFYFPRPSLSVVLSVINLFYGRQRNMSSNTRCSDCLDSEVFNVSPASAFSRSKTPLKWMHALGVQVAGRNYPPTNKNTPHSCTHRGMG